MIPKGISISPITSPTNEIKSEAQKTIKDFDLHIEGTIEKDTLTTEKEIIVPKVSYNKESPFAKFWKKNLFKIWSFLSLGLILLIIIALKRKNN